MTTDKNSQQSNLPSQSDYLPCGYRVYDIENTDPRVKCIFCRLIIKEPIQLTECGHRGCKGCFESRAADAIHDKMICPVEDCKCVFDKIDVRIGYAILQL